MMGAVRSVAPAIKAAETVVCHLAGEAKNFFWTSAVLAVLFPVGVTAGWLMSPGFLWSNAALFLILGTVCCVPLGIISAVCVVRSCVIADEQGVQWRKAGGWRSAAWEDVTAQFEAVGSPNSSVIKTQINLKTPQGTLVLWEGYWSSETQLREMIKRYAQQVSGPTLPGALPKRLFLPLTCRYDTAMNRNILGWLDDLHRYGLLAVVVYFGYQWFTTHTLPGWGWLLTPTGIFVIVKQTLPLALRPIYRATLPRLGDRVIADEFGLHFIDVQGESAVRWEDITDFYKAGIRYVIVTAEGSHDFLDTLTDAERLRAVILRRAVSAGRIRWRQVQTAGRHWRR